MSKKGHAKKPSVTPPSSPAVAKAVATAKDTAKATAETLANTPTPTTASHEFAFVKRVAETEQVKTIAASETLQWYWNTALGLYEKKAPSLVKTSVDRVSCEVRKVADPLLGKYGPSIDRIGCQTLDTVESRYAQTRDVYTASRKKVEDTLIKPVTEPAVKVYKMVDGNVRAAVETTVVRPASTAYDALLTHTETAVDTLLPEDEPVEQAKDALADAADAVADAVPGVPQPTSKPTLRSLSGRVSKRVQSRVFAKLQTAKAYTNKTFPFTVDLIDYASKNIDATYSKTKQLSQTGYEYAYSSVDYVKTASFDKVKADAQAVAASVKSTITRPFAQSDNKSDKSADQQATRDALKKRLQAAIDSIRASSSVGAFAVDKATFAYDNAAKAIDAVYSAGAKKNEDQSTVRKYFAGIRFYSSVYATEAASQARSLQDKLVHGARKFLGAIASSIEPVDSSSPAVPVDTDMAAQAM